MSDLLTPEDREWLENFEVLDEHANSKILTADEAGRVWYIQYLIRGQDRAFSNLFFMLSDAQRHNCGVCGEPDDPRCATEC